MDKTVICLALVATSICVTTGAPSLLSADTVLGRHTNPSTSRTESKNPFEPIQPIPLQLTIDERKAEVGKHLFNDRSLAANGRIACVDCHDLSQGGTSARAENHNLNKVESRLNIPTIFNVAFNKNYYWSARFTSLELQLDDAIKELGVTWEQLILKIQSNPQYVTLFNKVFPADGITVSNIKQAIVAYERSLITPNSRFDQYLRGDLQALSHQEKQGYELLKSYGCSACHQGINVGGNLAINPAMLYAKAQNLSSGNIPTDYNRLSLSYRGNTKIRVPSLRNVAITTPYFHDGSADTLEQAVIKMTDIMANTQLGIRIPPKDIELIVTFLRTLTGEYNGKAL
ncbi:cytochrome-c peroxidase [Kaarinaea lacus]